MEAITVAVEQLASLDEATRLFYYDLVVSRLDEASRSRQQALVHAPGYHYESEFARRYKAEGKASPRQFTRRNRQLTVKSPMARAAVANCTS